MGKEREINQRNKPVSFFCGLTGVYTLPGCCLSFLVAVVLEGRRGTSLTLVGEWQKRKAYL